MRRTQAISHAGTVDIYLIILVCRHALQQNVVGNFVADHNLTNEEAEKGTSTISHSITDIFYHNHYS